MMDTIFSMGIGWLINGSMILLAAATFFKKGIKVDSLEQAEEMLHPVLGHSGHWAALVFALALLCAGLASSITAGMAGGSVFAGVYGRAYDVRNGSSKAGVLLTLGSALLAVFFVTDSFRALLVSQMLLSVQLPVTILLLIGLTSSRRVMGAHANGRLEKFALWFIAAIVTTLNLMLLWSLFRGFGRT